jgi:hypothetical protein
LQIQLGKLYARAQSAWERGQRSEALAAYEQIMDLDPNYRDVASQVKKVRAIAG